MDRLLYVAMSGAKQTMLAQAASTNNLANVSTSGYKRERAIFEDLFYQNIRQPGGQTSLFHGVPLVYRHSTSSESRLLLYHDFNRG